MSSAIQGEVDKALKAAGVTLSVTRNEFDNLKKQIIEQSAKSDERFIKVTEILQNLIVTIETNCQRLELLERKQDGLLRN